MDDCIFCRIVAGEIPADTLFEDDELVVFRDIAPQAPVHFLVVPKKHLSGPAAIAQADEALAGKMVRVAARVAAEQKVGDAFRLVMNNGAKAGQVVFHLHLHVLGGKDAPWPI